MTARDSSSPQTANGGSGYTGQSPEPAAEARQDAPAPRRTLGRPWVKGCPSPNPSGRPRRSVELVEAAREHTAEALATLVEAMRNAKRISTRLRAAELVLERGWGRAPMSISVDLQARVGLADVTAVEWEALAMLRHAVRPSLPASEAVVEVEPDREGIAEGASALAGNELQTQAETEGES